MASRLFPRKGQRQAQESDRREWYHSRLGATRSSAGDLFRKRGAQISQQRDHLRGLQYIRQQQSIGRRLAAFQSAMREDHALRFAGRPRCEHDLGDRVWAHACASEVCARLGTSMRCRRRARTDPADIAQAPHEHRWGQLLHLQPIAYEDAVWRSHVDDAPHQFGRSRSIERDDGDTAQRAPPERCDHAAADRQEHAVTPEEAGALEARLGYPTHDPHGDPIPNADGQLASVDAIALSEQPIGHPAVIMHLEDEPPELFRQIAAPGLEPGMRIEVLEMSPRQLVVWDGDHEHVLSPVAAGSIFVAALPQPAAPVVRLSSLQPGAQGRVMALRSRGLTRRRLLDLGVTPGTVIGRAFTGPLGEPTAYQVRGALIALHAEQANQIEIEPLGRTAA